MKCMLFDSDMVEPVRISWTDLRAEEPVSRLFLWLQTLQVKRGELDCMVSKLLFLLCRSVSSVPRSRGGGGHLRGQRCIMM